MVTAVRVSAAAATEHFVRATVFLIFFFFFFNLGEAVASLTRISFSAQRLSVR